MVMALNTIWNEGGFQIQVENYRDRYKQTIDSHQTASYVGARWIDKGKGKTVITILESPSASRPIGGNQARPEEFVDRPDRNHMSDSPKRLAVISLEDIRWHLVLKGDVHEGLYSIPVNGNKDFDLVIRKDGTLSVRCLGGSFQNGVIEATVKIPPLQIPSSPPDTLTACSAVPSDPSTDTQPDLQSCHALSPTASELNTPPYSDRSSKNHPHVSSNRPASNPYTLSEISPDLMMLLEELRADQRRILQKEFQLVGAGFAERLLSGGRRLMGVSEPQEFLWMTALINLLVIPTILLVIYMYNSRRQSTTFTTLFFSSYDRARERVRRVRGRVLTTPPPSIAAVNFITPFSNSTSTSTSFSLNPLTLPVAGPSISSLSIRPVHLEDPTSFLIDRVPQCCLVSPDREGVRDDVLPPPYPWEESSPDYLS
ncbi:hypothetical protein [Phaffia rhodozyma]|uniref:Uncharacterized protein n=1 Tax=Phaffia rhodozyma TaxID=264483 RepID=A0A0F7SNY3_PHARH|nr:hypothetical protein [Phaffia rhodozyma]